ncbi:C4-dicarboxylate transport system permease large protein [Gracilibacillus halophilus YIM-C55.5]|uniref:C4-dicarboxylate transport system permease large protein n=1 Tax=Gracilibacillus halophilus YIM-C55.5 TaxID=1308866 RepID=N4WRR0_9BACI|nr:TRAP transporter large permease [Gracilibacillus halophilus]ENH95891.1 C4-dicarboxylate transport system permease large protein [Gracilibacillus halophilus YIM-C55.5]
MSAILFISLLLLFLLGVPIAVALGASSGLAVFFSGDIPLLVLVQRSFTSIDSFPLMAVPFFILAGKLMEVGGISERIIKFANTLTGHLKGGLGMVVVITSMFFSAISGSSAATTAAVGAILIPAMIRKGYDRNFAASVSAVSGELGVVIPPSVPLILFGVATGTSIGELFIAGILPGVLIGISLLLLVYIISVKRGYPSDDKASLKERWEGFKSSFLALLMPIIILGGIYGGVFTPTEAAAVAVLYAFIIGVFVYRQLTPKVISKALSDSAVTTSIVMFIIANAGLFGLILSREKIPKQVTEFFVGISSNAIVFLLLVNLLLIIVGMFMETSASIIILAPILTPVAIEMGLDPVHFGIVMIVNLALGMCTPPLGVNLFIACQIADIKLETLAKALILFFAMLIVDLLIIGFVPAISLMFL